ncbi:MULTISPECIES: NEL-type E3 ubiquitin ligase domain-containing protein [unclassified Pseudomonas]|uniref:NEL-type E3 ubiquitin ligase domain-containing protein n=1 Tax=unclassified Pseudomonas TaxID=196821 RepID=UPI001CBC3552|nr:MULTISPECIES: NEL-type E3 ubiquitin ligase domain-containing protein [unclassified Pseudomonas]
MSAKDPVTPAIKPFTPADQLSALMQMTGDLDTAESLQKTLPPWLTNATPEKITALAGAMRELQACQFSVQPTLDRLKPLNEFCRVELTEELTRLYGVAFDVERDGVELPGFDCSCPDSTSPEDVAKQKVIARRSLLQAAMHNFTEEETEDDGFPAGSIVRVASVPDGVPGLTPMAFAKVCRDLDVGKRYQTHFEATFKPAANDLDIGRLKLSALKVDAHTAYLKGHIGESAFQMFQGLALNSGSGQASGIKPILYETVPVQLQGLELFGSCLWGVVIFTKRSLKDHPADACVVYMPNEPDRPLYEYSTFVLFQWYLNQQLKVSTYAEFFAAYLDEANRTDFLTSAAKPQTWELKALSIPATLFSFLYQSHVTKLKSDALVLAVPTAEVDADVRQKRLLAYEETGLLIANIAGLFVPVLGQLMMGVAVGQLLGEVYDGIEDWRHDDKAGAMAHLLNVAENMAMMAAFAAGTKVAGSLIKRTVAAHPDFFGRFAAVKNAAGKPRLWQSDVAPYRRAPAAGGIADAKGVYQVNAQRWVNIDGASYEIAFDTDLSKWRVRHPARSDAFSPVVEHNNEGGWRFAHEHPQEWRSGLYALKRIDPRLAALHDGRLENLRKITDSSVSQLNRLGEENRVLPARLKDCIERFRIEQELSDFIASMESGHWRSADHAQTQLHTLPSLPGWPAERYIEVLDGERKVTAMYPSSTLVADEELSVKVTEEQLRKGELLETVVAGLYPSEVEALSGAKVAGSTQSSALAKKLGAAIKADRRSAFKDLYQRYDQSSSGDVQKIRGVFPELPAGLAQELIADASSVERLHLRTSGRVAMGLAQRVRQSLADVRLDRALAGLYLPEIAEADTRKLAVQLLPRLNGWSDSLRIELREGSLTGPLSASAGKEDAALKRIIVNKATGLEAFGSDGKSLGTAASGPNGLYLAVLRAIPPDQRTTMGIATSGESDGLRLRSDLLGKGLDDRASAGRVVSGATLDESVHCLQADPPAPGSTHPRALMRKVKKLYPLFSDIEAQTFLDELGSEPLVRAREVRSRQQALKALRGALDLWSKDEAGLSAAAEKSERRQSRRQMSDLIENGWRRLSFLGNEKGMSVPGLKLDGMRAGKLPTLPIQVDFDHVQALSLKNMDLDNDAAYFLKAFKNLESLELNDNKLTQLPEVLSLMPKLKHLSLANNDLQLTEQTLKKLSGMRALESLNLSGNRRLGATLDVGKQFDLRYLSLRDTRATELPKNLSYPPNLDRVDLRDNEIKVLPDWLFSTPRRFSETVNLRNNPLANVSRTQLKSYRDRVGIGMGFLEDDLQRLNEQRARELWLPDEWGLPARTASWTAIKDDPASDGLFRLLAELGDTADTEHVREDMTRRVWRVLEAAQVDTPLREQVFELAANPINCTDSAALNFSHLEVAVEVDKVINPTSGRSSAAPLLKLGRGLFRLDQLEQIAQARIAQDPKADPLEVSLAFRTGLAETLELPGQPRHMRYAQLSGVTPAMLNAAEQKIKAAELTPAFMRFLNRQPFWTDFLSRSYPRQFDSLNQTYPAKLQAVFENAESLTTAEYLRQVSVIKAEKEAAENTVFEHLTQEALRVTEGGVCGLPER